MTLKGAGIEKTIITHTAAWKPSTKTLPDPEMKTAGMDTQAYLLRLKDKAANIAISDLTLRGPQLHGAIYGWDNQNCHLHHNTFKVNFSIEFPFEGDEDMEIDHNICEGTISIPKYAGGSVPLSGRTFHIHHNWMRDSYSIEFVRNGVEIDHNLFDFDVKNDGGNLISSFGSAPAKGPMRSSPTWRSAIITSSPARAPRRAKKGCSASTPAAISKPSASGTISSSAGASHGRWCDRKKAAAR